MAEILPIPSNPIDWECVDAAVFDLDGTLYLGESPLPGAMELLRSVPSRVSVKFLSNNTSKTPEQTYEKMLRLGFTISSSQVLSPLHGLCEAIRTAGFTKVWVMANAPVLAWLRAAMPQVDWRAPRSQTECVIVTYDTTLTYQDLCEVAWRLQDGCAYWVTHPDYVCPDPQGPVPDVGGLVEMWAIGYGRRPERCFGKPSPEVLSPVLANTSAERVLFVGDRLYTDWELSRQAKTQFRLSLAGETTPEMWLALQGERPLILPL